MSDTPVQDTLIEMTAASVSHGSLAPREHMLARLATLIAIDAPAASYLLNLGATIDVGVTLEDVEGTLVAVAPLVGTARILSATANIGKALGFAIGVAEVEAEEEADEASETV